MKIREGFVSNSSASSFLILRNKIIPKNLEIFLNENDKTEYSWYISERPEYIYGTTDLDSFDAIGLLESLGVKEEYIIQEEYGNENRMFEKAMSIDSKYKNTLNDLVKICQEMIDSIREERNLNISDDFDDYYLNKIDKILNKL